MRRPKILVLASGEPEAGKGGSGFKNLVVSSKDPINLLNADIVAVASNHAMGGVADKAREFNVPFHHFPKPWSPTRYKEIFAASGAEYTACSGWLRLVVGLDPRTTFNIHPGPLPHFGGRGYYGHHVHAAVCAARDEGTLTHTEVCMHFVSETKSEEDYDKGPVFFRFRIPLVTGETPDELAKRVNAIEHKYQPFITHLVVTGQISWDGKDPQSLTVPEWYLVNQSA